MDSPLPKLPDHWESADVYPEDCAEVGGQSRVRRKADVLATQPGESWLKAISEDSDQLSCPMVSHLWVQGFVQVIISRVDHPTWDSDELLPFGTGGARPDGAMGAG